MVVGCIYEENMEGVVEVACEHLPMSRKGAAILVACKCFFFFPAQSLTPCSVISPTRVFSAHFFGPLKKIRATSHA